MKTGRRMPSPALVLGVVALVVAMSGAAIALPGKNSVKSNDIAKGSVKSKQIKADAVKKKHLKEGSVTAAAIAEGAVGSAAIADGAVGSSELAADSVNGSKVANGSLGADDLGDYDLLDPSQVRVTATEAATLDAARTAAPETLLFRRGPVEIYAKCYRDTTAGVIEGAMFARTTANGAMMEGEDDLPGGLAVLLNTNTLETDREFDTQSESGANEASFDEAEGLLMSPDGDGVNILSFIGVKQGSLPGGNGPFSDGNVCLFGGSVTG